MKFAHMADMHIGGWQDPNMEQLGLDTFKKALEKCIEENVEFILFAGDLFNTALPQIDLIKEVAISLKKVKDKNIPIYYIAGSHDFSPSGKTMLEVFEKVGLIHNVTKFDNEGKLKFTNLNNNVKITGLLGKKGGLDKVDYSNLKKEHLENETGFKIFMFHTAINEYKPQDLEQMEGIDIDILPKNFNYYAGGHVHYILKAKHENGYLTFPGALFPNNFKELEKYKHGGFYLIDDNLNIEYMPIKLKEVLTFNFDANNKNPSILTDEMIHQIKSQEIKDKIILIRIIGTLTSGKPSDLKFNDIFKELNEAFYIGKNIAKLKSQKFQKIKVEKGSVEEVEEKIVNNYLEKDKTQIKNKNYITKELITLLDKEKKDGEKTSDFEKRIFSEVENTLELDLNIL